ncbi:hypothetical protein HMPREF0454_02963 [Hafnia alvei ATCC 51873]|uniref:Uncharacterized protein n=1 Tax=Hafnia alvei ATCC 51873 TaxID=1002364 RepID=G9Y8U0_HAFAL|nr:hypothetical protein HMPREF0454_02963 [Hafnia alvei ATCC 51873]
MRGKSIGPKPSTIKTNPKAIQIVEFIYLSECRQNQKTSKKKAR